MITLRPYQQDAIDAIYRYYETGNAGNILIVLPTGSGKSVILAEFMRGVLEKWPNQRILMLAHRRELLQQNADKLFKLWPFAPAGIYSAGLNKRELGHAITIAGIQSIYDKGNQVGWCDLVLCDESHLVPPEGEGMYRTLLNSLREINPAVKIIGFTATPYRMKTGMLTDDGGFFTNIAYEISISELISQGFLSRLVTKRPATQANLEGVHVRGGEFVAGEAEARMDTHALTRGAISEIEKYASDRKSWLVFASGVRHASNFAAALRDKGHDAQVIIGDTPPILRASYIEQFRTGKLKCLVNCDVLTTGFDAPNIDLVVLLRPTRSPGLYYQMVGRAFRLSPETGKTTAMVLDFSGNIDRHGPIDDVRILPARAKRTNGETATLQEQEEEHKTCPECQSVIQKQIMICPDCQYEFPKEERKATHAIEAAARPILTTDVPAETLAVGEIFFSRHKKPGKPDSLKVTYRCNYGPGNLQTRSIAEWVCLEHQGYARQKAMRWWVERHRDYAPDNVAALVRSVPETVTEALERTRELKKVGEIKVRRVDSFDRIVEVQFAQDQALTTTDTPDGGFTWDDLDEVPF